MPQFESQYFISQIFWLLVCFSIIYITIGKVYIPKIKAIVKKRAKNQDKQNSTLQKIENEIATIKAKNESEKQKLAKNYSDIINKAKNKIQSQKDSELLKINKKIDDLNIQSEKIIKNFQAEFQNYYTKVSPVIKQKITNKFN